MTIKELLLRFFPWLFSSAYRLRTGSKLGMPCRPLEFIMTRHVRNILFLILMTIFLTASYGCGGSGRSGNDNSSGSLTGSGK
jgi:uncharacterized membrane protein YgcG